MGGPPLDSKILEGRNCGRHRSGLVRIWATQQEASLNVMSLNHPETMPPPWSMEKLSSVKLVPGARKAGIAVLESPVNSQSLEHRRSLTEVCQNTTQSLYFILLYFLKDFIYSFLERWEGRKREKHRCASNTSTSYLSHTPTTQACALTGNQTSDLSVHRLALNPLIHNGRSSKPLF